MHYGRRSVLTLIRGKYTVKLVKAGLTMYQNGEAILYQLFEYLIIQVTHPPLGQFLRGFRGGGREPASPWCSAPVPDRAADRGRSACATARRQMHQMDNQIFN